MYGAILEKADIIYTDMYEILKALNGIELKYNWLLANYECNYYPNEQLEKNRHNYLWISGDQLSRLLKKAKIQFIWGVFCAFETTVSLDSILKYELPKSNNIDFSKNDECVTQNPLSTLEIVAWDSKAVFIISKEEQPIKYFLESFPLAESLY